MPSSSLIPTDPSVLFTSAGMQQFIPYLSGEKNVLEDFKTKHLVSVQKCFRAVDIEEVGDDTHHTFFEMLGNWSIGEDPQNGYFKEGAIKYALEFFVDKLRLDKKKFYTTFFIGEGSIPKDQESINIWKENGITQERMKGFGIEDNFWGPVGEAGPCGPCSEIHYDRGEKYGCGSLDCGPNCKKCDRFVELWNLVFLEYDKNQDGSYAKLPQRNVDTGIGFERLASVLQKKESAYESDLFLPVIEKIERISGQSYASNKKYFRIIADHIRGSVFLISAGILPSNIERGSVLRNIIRRATESGRTLNLSGNFLISLAQTVIETYKDIYPELKPKETDILTVIQKEEEEFEKSEPGREKIAVKMMEEKRGEGNVITGGVVYDIFGTTRIGRDRLEQLAEERNIKIIDLKKGFEEGKKKHQEISRAGAESKFGGVGKEASYEATKLHTATHLLHTALRRVLGEHVKQMGSDITSQRLRFDFQHPSKMTEDQIKEVEDLVNQKIKEDLEVKKEETGYEEAITSGALAFFKEKYPQIVSVYSVGSFSKEICAGPHVKRTSEIGQIKITKEESSGAGIRRIRAILVK